MRKKRVRERKDPLAELHTFFLACEFKPKSELWAVLDPFAYDVQPAFTFGSLGIINYDPVAYAIIEATPEGNPLLGYIMTITHAGTVLLLDKIKGYNGTDYFNYHLRKIVKAYTDVETDVPAWCYVLSDDVAHGYTSIEQVEFGLHDDQDEQQKALLAKLEET